MFEIWTFFYGSHMNFDVLGEVNYIPKKWEVARHSAIPFRECLNTKHKLNHGYSTDRKTLGRDCP